jgi:hypothetical protein
MSKLTKAAKDKRFDKPICKLKKLLWTEFALYNKMIRSECGRYCSCYTCGKSLEIGTSNCQMGHWLPKGGYSVHYFNEDNVRPQCYHCNISLSGNTAVFEHNLRNEIGHKEVNNMFDTRLEKVKRDKAWYIDKIDDYKRRVSECSCDQ